MNSNSNIINEILNYDKDLLNNQMNKLIEDNIKNLSIKLNQEVNNTIQKSIQNFYSNKCLDYEDLLYNNTIFMFSRYLIELKNSLNDIFQKNNNRNFYGYNKSEIIEIINNFLIINKCIIFKNSVKRIDNYTIINKNYIIIFSYNNDLLCKNCKYNINSIYKNELPNSILYTLKILSEYIKNNNNNFKLSTFINHFYQYFLENKQYFLENYSYIEIILEKEKKKYNEKILELENEKMFYEDLCSELIEKKEHYENLEKMYLQYQKDKKELMQEKLKFHKLKKDFEIEKELFQNEKNKFNILLKELNIEDYFNT